MFRADLLLISRWYYSVYTAIGMSCVYVDWLLAAVNPWIRISDCDSHWMYWLGNTLYQGREGDLASCQPEKGGWHCHGNLSLLKGIKQSSTQDMWPYSRPLKNYTARQLCPKCISHLLFPPRSFQTFLVMSFGFRLSWSLHSTPDFLVASSTHLHALWLLLIFSAIDCPSSHWLFGIGRSLSCCFYPSLFADWSISLHLISYFSHILSSLITLLCIFLSPRLIFLHVLSTGLAYCRGLLFLLAITAALTVLPLLLPMFFPQSLFLLVTWRWMKQAPPKCSYFVF